jgi:membrane-associated phospholipid phosphatase
MNRREKSAFVLLCATSLASAQPACASEEGWDDAGSLTRDALVIAAFGVPVLQGDWDGALQAGGSIGAASIITYGLKETFPEIRPDGSDNKSFPSGHTSVSFAAAATMQNRHGWKVGIPAHLAAAFVGLSRVEARKHHVHDVLVGAAIGEATGFLITHRKDARVQVFPWGDTKSGGVALSMRF